MKTKPRYVNKAKLASVRSAGGGTSAPKKYKVSAKNAKSVLRDVGFAVADRVHPALGAAARLGSAAYEAYNRNKRSVGVQGRLDKYNTRGYYSGKFPKFKKVKRDIWREKGVVHTTEVHGTVSDPDCVYVGQSSYSGFQLIEIICMTLLKKLFQKTGWICKDVTQTLPSFSDGKVSNLWRLELTRLNTEDGTTNILPFFTTSGLGDFSIYTLVGNRVAGVVPQWPDFVNAMYGYAVGQAGGGSSGELLNVLQPHTLRLYRQEGNVDTFYQFEAEIVFEHEIMTLFSKSELKIQNRTLAAGGGKEADDVSNNPLEGYQYYFSSGSPKCKNNIVGLNSSVDITGVMAARAGLMTNSLGYKEPPSPNLFWNCTGVRKVRLEPGQIKSLYLYHKKKMPLLKFMKICNIGFGPAGKQTNLFGKSCMFALEDCINVNPSQNVSIAYEVNRTFGCMLTSYKRACTQGIRYDAEFNLVPPTS